MVSLKRKTGGNLDMTQGRPIQLILRFSLPLLLGNILQQLYNMVDSAVAGTFVGKVALSAVATGYPIVFMLTSTFAGISIGGTILIAQFYGAKDLDGARRTVRAVYFGITVVCVPLMLLGIFGAEPLLRLFQTPADVLPHAVVYVRVIFAGLLGGMLYNVNAGILQGLGDSRTSLRFLAIACVLNLALDLLFVAVFRMGVFGTALATIIAQGISGVLSILFINRHYPFLRIRLFSGGVEFVLVRKALALGIPASFSNLQYSVGMLVIQALINSYGIDFIAGVSAATKVDSFAFMPILSYCSAITTYIGHNIGARRLDRVQEGVRATLVLACGTCVLMAALLVPFGRPIMSIFNREPAVLDAGMAYLYRIMIPTAVLAVLYVLNAVLRGAGEIWVPTISGVVALWVVRIPAAYFLAGHFGRDNLFFSFLIGWCAGLLITVPHYLQGKWKDKHTITFET